MVKSLILPAILAAFLLAAFPGSANDTGVRGQVATDAADSFTWTPQNFAGFYYDANNNLGTEVLSATITEGRKLSGDEPYGLVYRTTAQMDNFDFEDWGSYYAIGFLGKNYPYRVAEDMETGEIKSPVATGSFEWNSQNFAGFYYDLDGDLGREDLRAEITDGNILSEYDGLTYTTQAQANGFSFEEFGKYYVIGFLGEKYFAGYIDSMDEWVSYPLLYQESKDENSMASGQLEKIVMDESSEQVIEMGSQLMLEEGYELLIKGVSEDGRCYLHLLKNGDLVQSKIIAPSVEGATLADKTFIYKKDVGSQKGLVIIAVYFKNAYRDGARGAATVDGIWQISEEPVSIEADEKFGKMRVASIDSNNMMLTMDNLGNQIALERSTDIRLMGNIGLKAADQSTIDEPSPLRYYIYKTEADAEPARNS